MIDTQLYLTIGLPTIAVLVGILINGMQYSHATAALSARLASVETRLDMLITKIMEFEGRISRIEERLERR